jgi:hypothetical protein
LEIVKLAKMTIKLNTSIVILILWATAFTSCSDNDDDKNPNSIVGRWQVEKKEHVCPDPSGNTTYPDNTIWEFRSDGTYAVYNSGNTTPILESTYERPNSNIIYLCYSGSCSTSYSTTFSVNKLIIEETDPFDTECALRYTFNKL